MRRRTSKHKQYSRLLITYVWCLTHVFILVMLKSWVLDIKDATCKQDNSWNLMCVAKIMFLCNDGSLPWVWKQTFTINFVARRKISPRRRKQDRGYNGEKQRQKIGAWNFGWTNCIPCLVTTSLRSTRLVERSLQVKTLLLCCGGVYDIWRKWLDQELSGREVALFR